MCWTMSINFVILAAGKGTRMNSKTPKFFQTIAEKPIIRYIIDTCKHFSSNIIVVTQESLLKHELFADVTTAQQSSPKGTGDAILQAIPFLNADNTIILCGDMPLIETKHLELLMNSSKNSLMTMVIPDEFRDMPYGRVILNEGNFEKIIEYKNATDSEKLVLLANTGVYKIETSILKKYIGKIKQNPLTQEFYLTDLFEILKTNGIDISVIQSKEYWPFHGINTMEDLAKAEEIMQNRLRKKFMNNGVKLLNPKTTYFAFDTQIDSEVVIEQNVIIKKGVRIHSNARINAFSHISECEIMEKVEIGPFARVRGNAKFMESSAIGNFVEVKGSLIGKNSKAKHLSYIGDATIGSDSNIGAGTITCNYDGVKKYKTTIGNKAFVGSNSTLIAPLAIGDNTIIGAGSVINKDVSKNSLAIARCKQNVISNGAEKIWKSKKNVK